MGDNILRSGRKGSVAITSPDGGKVRGCVVEASAKMCTRFNSDRLFGVVNNETITCVDEKVAPLGLKVIWEGYKDFRPCFIINFCGIEKNMWHRDLRSTRTEGVNDWVIGVNYPPGSGCHHLVELGLATEGGMHEVHQDLGQGWHSED